MQHRYIGILRYLVMVSVMLLLASCGSGVSQAQRPTAAPTQPTEEITLVPPTPMVVTPMLVPAVAPTASATTTATTSEIAYLQDGNIWLLDVASSATHQITQRGEIGSFTWTPDGNSFVFSAGSENADLYEMKSDGSELVQLTRHTAREVYPAFSRDGNLYFVRHIVDGELPTIEIVRRDPDGTETVGHSEPGGLCVETGLRFHSETEFALSLNCGRGSVVLLGMLGSDTTTSLETSLAAGCAYTAVPAHTKHRLAVLASVECLPHQSSIITLLDLDDASRSPGERFIGAGIGTLDWSPDDHWLAFSTGTQDETGLWLLEVEGQTAPIRLAADGQSPMWRPDGNPE